MVIAAADVISRAPRIALEPLLFIFYTSELFHIVRNHIVGYADDTTIFGDEIAESGFGSSRFVVYEVAHEAQP